MLFYYLLAGHLVGDFALQTNWIASKKEKGIRWILLHTLIVTLSITFFSLPFGLKVLPFVFINGIMHFIIDFLKLKTKSGNTIKTFLYFILDQILHIVIVFFTALYFKIDVLPAFAENFIFLIISFIFILSFSSVFIQLVLKIVSPLNNESFYYKNEKSIGNINRIVFFNTILLSYYNNIFYLMIIPLYLIMLIFYYKYKMQEWMHIGYFKIKLMLEIIFAVGGFGLYVLLKDLR